MPTKFETEITVRPSDIDANRHVHNTVYFDYVLVARYDQMKRCYKMPMDEFDRRGWSWVVRSASIEHKRPLALGDTAVVRTWVGGIGDKAGGKRARSLVTIGFEVDNKQSGKPVEIPDFVVESYSI